jgi:hypothetical protein
MVILNHSGRVCLEFDNSKNYSYFLLKYPHIEDDLKQAYGASNPGLNVLIKEIEPGPSAYSVTAVPEKAEAI